MTNTFSSGLKSALSMEGRGIRQACQKPAGERKSWNILGIHRYGDALRRRTRAHRIVKGPAHAHRPRCPALLAARPRRFNRARIVAGLCELRAWGVAAQARFHTTG